MAKKNRMTLPFSVGDEMETEITALNDQGEGIGRANGVALFVANALPGERVRVRITRLAARYAAAEVTEFLSVSPDRVTPPCPHFARCGGCALQHLSYEGQLRQKRKKVADCLTRIGGFDGEALTAPAHAAPDAWHYRNKASFPVAGEKGKARLGFYARASHDLIAVSDCMLQMPPADDALRAVKAWMDREGIEPYREQTHTGLVRHVQIRTNRKGEFALTLVCKNASVPAVQSLIAELQRVPGFISLTLNINPDRTNAILGRQTKTLFGADRLEETLHDLTFSLSPASFFQVNPVQTEHLYAMALERAALTGTETVMDAYCGIGTISLFLARKAGSVLGVEIVPDAIADAKRNAERFGITNARFVCGKAEEVLVREMEKGALPDVLVVDPPRKGCDPALLDAAANVSVPRIVYVSCDPATLARDCKYLAEKGYAVVSADPVDLFPQTVHVETVVLMSRVKE